jgi:threonine dehydrogenase-like Zn-dependent dehydrogenase
MHGLSRLRYVAPSPAIIFGDGPLGLLFLCVLKSISIERVDLVGG